MGTCPENGFNEKYKVGRDGFYCRVFLEGPDSIYSPGLLIQSYEINFATRLGKNFIWCGPRARKFRLLKSQKAGKQINTRFYERSEPQLALDATFASVTNYTAAYCRLPMHRK